MIVSDLVVGAVAVVGVVAEVFAVSFFEMAVCRRGLFGGLTRVLLLGAFTPLVGIGGRFASEQIAAPDGDE